MTTETTRWRQRAEKIKKSISLNGLAHSEPMRQRAAGPVQEALEKAADPLSALPSGLSGRLWFGARDIQAFAHGYDSVPEPLALLDFSLVYIFKNKAFRDLLHLFGYPDNVNLPDSLAGAMSQEKIDELCECLQLEGRGHTWKGLISYRSRDAASFVAKLHIFPLWTDGGTTSRPSAFALYMEDVTEENKRVMQANLDALLRASLKKDQDTGRHVVRVNSYARRLAEVMLPDSRWPQVNMDFIDNISFLASMHDVGKIGTPDDILNKQGALNEFEWIIMKEHTINGAYILSSYPHPMAKEIALSHHEWWDGSGYPYNFAGEMIPLSARIVALADVYDALRMKRSYKPAYDHATAIGMMKNEAGTHFDPELVELLLRIEKDFCDIFDKNAD